MLRLTGYASGIGLGFLCRQGGNSVSGKCGVNPRLRSQNAEEATESEVVSSLPPSELWLIVSTRPLARKTLLISTSSPIMEPFAPRLMRTYEVHVRKYGV